MVINFKGRLNGRRDENHNPGSNNKRKLPATKILGCYQIYTLTLLLIQICDLANYSIVLNPDLSDLAVF